MIEGSSSDEYFELEDAVCVRADGTKFPAHIAVCNISTRGGGWRGLCFTFRDFTDEKAAEQKISEVDSLEKKVQEADKVAVKASL